MCLELLSNLSVANDATGSVPKLEYSSCYDSKTVKQRISKIQVHPTPIESLRLNECENDESIIDCDEGYTTTPSVTINSGSKYFKYFLYFFESRSNKIYKIYNFRKLHISSKLSFL